MSTLTTARTALSLPRHSVRWVLAHGIIRALNAREARRGNPIARLMSDPSARAEPWSTYAGVREQGPVLGEGSFRVTASHAVAAEILRSDAFGVPAANAHFPEPLHSIFTATLSDYDVGPVDPPSLLALDAPDHTRLRRLVARHFTARRVAQMADDVTATTLKLLDELESVADGGPVDLVEHFSARLPVAVISHLLGVPDDRRDEVLAWGNEGAKQLDGGLGYREFLGTTRAVTDMHGAMDQHIADLRANPGDDLLSSVIRSADAQPVEERPTAVELRMIALLVLGAGFETTVNLISNAVGRLDENPDERARCLADPALWDNAVEEVLRHDSPVQLTGRTAVRDTTVAGVDLPAGTTVLILLGGTNRDPEVFADPDRFDVGRGNADDHLAFSLGAHFCLGAQLARLEARVALRELYARFPDLRVTGTPVRKQTQVLRGFEHLPVELGRRA
jgi:cytochrome P450